MDLGSTIIVMIASEMGIKMRGREKYKLSLSLPLKQVESGTVRRERPGATQVGRPIVQLMPACRRILARSLADIEKAPMMSPSGRRRRKFARPVLGFGGYSRLGVNTCYYSRVFFNWKWEREHLRANQSVCSFARPRARQMNQHDGIMRRLNGLVVWPGTQ